MQLLSTVDLLHYWLELSYFVFGGFVLAGIAAIGLYQLIHTRKQLELANEQLVFAKEALKTTSRREAFSLTAECCDHYLSTVIPLLNKLDKKIESKGITFYKDATVTISGDEIRITGVSANQDADARIEIASHSANALNALEGFAVYFVSGVADESVAYETVGRTFVNSTKKLAPDFLQYSTDGYFRNLTRLFILWSKREEKQRIEFEKLILEKKSETISTKKISAIGTE